MDYLPAYILIILFSIILFVNNHEIEILKKQLSPKEQIIIYDWKECKHAR